MGKKKQPDGVAMGTQGDAVMSRVVCLPAL